MKPYLRLIIFAITLGFPIVGCSEAQQLENISGSWTAQTLVAETESINLTPKAEITITEDNQISGKLACNVVSGKINSASEGQGSNKISITKISCKDELDNSNDIIMYELLKTGKFEITEDNHLIVRNAELSVLFNKIK